MAIVLAIRLEVAILPNGEMNMRAEGRNTANGGTLGTLQMTALMARYIATSLEAKLEHEAQSKLVMATAQDIPHVS